MNILDISTHAPARGATPAVLFISQPPGNFNPRSREGSDLTDRFYDCYSADFNPRSREGSDLSALPDPRTLRNFNPRSREGSDKQYCNLPGLIAISTHAPARGATLAHPASSAYGLFQPTLPRGERHKKDVKPIQLSIFQPTLPRGERLMFLKC